MRDLMAEFLDDLIHFNAGALRRMIESLRTFLGAGGGLVVTLAGALSTAGIGRSLAPLIRRGSVELISCTGANLEEDLFRLMASDRYEEVDWRIQTPAMDADLAERGMNRITDVAVPEDVIREVEDLLLTLWHEAEAGGHRRSPASYLSSVAMDPNLTLSRTWGRDASWLCAAAEAGIPVVVPGWEDSTMGNIFAARLMDGTLNDAGIVRSGVEAMVDLIQWYRGRDRPIGFLQLGGGIAGDFPICVVPLIRQDLGEEVPFWAWFGQIQDGTTSYGGYSAAPPSEKISWGKLRPETPMHVVESDATLVAPILFRSILNEATSP